MKKVLINIFFIITMFCMLFMQMNFFNWFTISSVMPNLFVIYVLFIGLYTKKYVVITYASLLGVLLGSLFAVNMFTSVISYMLVAVISIMFGKNFSKDSRITIVVMVCLATLLHSIFVCAMNFFIEGSYYNIWKLTRVIMIESVYNAILVIILYPVFQKIGPWIENEYKASKILTRYF